MLAIFPFDNATRGTTCHRALEAAAEAVCAVDRAHSCEGAPQRHAEDDKALTETVKQRSDLGAAQRRVLHPRGQWQLPQGNSRVAPFRLISLTADGGVANTQPSSDIGCKTRGVGGQKPSDIDLTF